MMSRLFCRTLLSLFITVISFCATSAFAEDGQDHPMVGRYPGTTITQYDYKEFEEAQILLSKPYEKNGEMLADKLLPLEGQVTYIHYDVPKTVSAFQVFRNYQLALAKGGFKELFVCNRPCTTNNLSDFKSLLKARDLYLNYSIDNQYIAAQSGNVYVSMFVNNGGVWLFVIEKGDMATDKVSVVGSSPIADALNKAGRVDVYGLTFDTGKSTLKQNSKATLTELAEVLTNNPQMKLDVIGHTDNVGTADSNLQLSQDRADAVVTALINDYGINPTRLTPSGKGQTQPVASNDTEKGKATNRRVEFVLQQVAMTNNSSMNNNNERSVNNRHMRNDQQRNAPSQNQDQNQDEPKSKVNVNDILDTANRLRSWF